MDDKSNKRIQELLRLKEELLRDNPELRAYQKEIDEALEKAGNDPIKRAEALNNMLIQLIEQKLAPALMKIRDKFIKKGNKTDSNKERDIQILTSFYLHQINEF